MGECHHLGVDNHREVYILGVGGEGRVVGEGKDDSDLSVLWDVIRNLEGESVGVGGANLDFAPGGCAQT